MIDLQTPRGSPEGPSCFSVCFCSCDSASGRFDDTVRAETRFPWTLRELCHSNIGWYTDRSVGPDNLIKEWDLRGKSGLYLLWHKDDYCGVHGRYHMRALYVGKGSVRNRILAHWKAKDFSEEMLVYWTFVEMPNRAAKYYEQVLLDTYSFPANRAENDGGARLCGYLPQGEVD